MVGDNHLVFGHSVGEFSDVLAHFALVVEVLEGDFVQQVRALFVEGLLHLAGFTQVSSVAKIMRLLQHRVAIEVELEASLGVIEVSHVT